MSTVLVIDNYDSFTYNLVQYLGELGAAVVVHRNDAIGLSDVENLGADGIVISPGPCAPDSAGISVELSAGSPDSCRCSGCASAIRPSAWPSARGWCETTASCTARRATSTTRPSASCRACQSVRRGPLPLARHRRFVTPGRARRHRLDRSRGDHGYPAPRARDRRGPVPSGVRAHAERQATARQLAVAGGGERMSAIERSARGNRPP